jgi:hypothetical protein
MLWKSATRVGFGYSGAFVVARYCADAKAKPAAEYPKPPKKNLSAYALNVCPIGGCPACPKPVPGLGYNNCYNDRSLLYVNDLRKMVG